MEATSEEHLWKANHSEDSLKLLSCCKVENSIIEFLTLKEVEKEKYRKAQEE